MRIATIHIASGVAVTVATALTCVAAAPVWAVGHGRPATAAAGAAHERADGCWQDGGRWYCRNRAHAPIRQGDRVVGYVVTTTSVFRCRSDAGENHGGTHPTRWVYTQADEPASRPWGWMSDNDIYSETDPLPVC